MTKKPEHPDLTELAEARPAIETAKKLHAFADKMKAERGDMELIALVQREAGRKDWDLVLSAPWLHETREDYKFVFDRAMPLLTLDERKMIAQIVILRRSDVFVQALTDFIQFQHSQGIIAMTGARFGEVAVERLIIVYCGWVSWPRKKRKRRAPSD